MAFSFSLCFFTVLHVFVTLFLMSVRIGCHVVGHPEAALVGDEMNWISIDACLRQELKRMNVKCLQHEILVIADCVLEAE